VTGVLGVQLAKGLEVLDAQVVAELVGQCVLQDATVTVAQDEAVPVTPQRVGRDRDATRPQSITPSGASAIAVPLWPELALAGASMATATTSRIARDLRGHSRRGRGCQSCLEQYRIALRRRIGRPTSPRHVALQIPPNCDLTLGMVCVEKSVPGATTWRVRVDERFLNPAGVVQGGFSRRCSTRPWAPRRSPWSVIVR
jgi:hypothetical protein